MKNLFLLPVLALVVLLASCSSDDDGGNDLPKVFNKTFIGKLKKDGVDLENVECNLAIIANTATVVFNKLSIIDGKDLMLQGLNAVGSDGNYEISGTNLHPVEDGIVQEDKVYPSVKASLRGDKFHLVAETGSGTLTFETSEKETIKPVQEGKSYKGEFLSGEYKQPEATVDITIDGATNQMDIVMNNAKFAPKMPELVIRIKGVPFVENGKVLEFEAKDIVPYMNDETEPASSFCFANVNGKIEGDRLQFDARMSDDCPVPGVAGMVFLFDGLEIIE